MQSIEKHREFMKSCFGAMRGVQSDQSRGLPPPPLQLAPDEGAELIDLPAPDAAVLQVRDLFTCIRNRRSRRDYCDANLTMAELSFLLWATQGVERVLDGGHCTLRTVPSAGARHPFETYLFVHRVADVAPGVYRYLPLSHQLTLRFRDGRAMQGIAEAACRQDFLADAAVVFVWACVPYRGEWRYPLAAHKAMLLDAGHVCQNLYLACEAIGAGTCAVAAYDQEAVDRLLRLDGKDEFVIYMAPVAKV